MKKRTLKNILLSIVALLMVVIIVVGCYLEYVIFQYYRIEDNKVLEIVDRNDNLLDINNSYTISTYNIGFGAYEQDYSFFMDEGHMKDGTYVTGKYAKAKSKEVVLTNTNGAIETIKNLNSDFVFFQEVDKKATRSYKVNQYQMILNSFSEYDATYASNFHSAYLMYPFNDMIGKTEAGIVTLSKYSLDSSIRYSLPIDESFPTRFFDLDRCFSLNRIKLSNGKDLVLINVHLSAYDEGGVIRKLQLEVLNNILKQERDNGNYVIAGGDFNHDIANSINLFETQQEVPEWVYSLSNDDLTDGYKFQTAVNYPTCRSTDISYTPGVNYSVVIDGFIISDNIEVISSEVISQNNELFLYSDHNPVKMEFKLIN
jgi:endonuclease/exonuclease/phosphatase family metal-dependent hydrolase/uncharacterized protein YxeA